MVGRHAGGRRLRRQLQDRFQQYSCRAPVPRPCPRTVIHYGGRLSLTDHDPFNVTNQALAAQVAVASRDFAPAGVTFRSASVTWHRRALGRAVGRLRLGRAAPLLRCRLCAAIKRCGPAACPLPRAAR